MRPGTLVVAAFVAAAGPVAGSDLLGGLLTNSHTCGICHRDIYRMWLSSAHARSMEGAVFLAALHETGASEGEAVSRLCLKCHAPLADVAGDVRLEKKVSWDGVSCDACHSITAVDTTASNPRLTYDWGKVKRGPIRDAASSAHGTAYSELHTSSLICIGCHEYSNDEGTPILSTYSEWKESAAAKNGENCQDCHMGRTQANVVDPRVVRVPESSVNLHEVPGGHSLNQLHKAIRAKISPERHGDRLDIEVRLSNVGAGHAVPTGMPGRRLVMVLNVRTKQGESFEEKRVYSRTYVDAAGQPIEQEHRCFGKGVRIASDTRLQSGEDRVETFGFPVPASVGGSIGLKVYYEHSPTGTPEDRTWLTVFSEERTVPPGTRRHGERFTHPRSNPAPPRGRAPPFHGPGSGPACEDPDPCLNSFPDRGIQFRRRNMNIGIIGSGVVGKALGAGFLKHGDEVMIGTREPAKLDDWLSANPPARAGDFAEAATFGDVVVLAVKGAAAGGALRLAGPRNFSGKTIIDATNPIADLPPVNGVIRFFTTLDESLMERLQRQFPDARFVKAFSSVGNAWMVNPSFPGGRPTMFVCGNDEGAKKTVTSILDRFGWETADMGRVEAARAIEPLCMLWCIPGFLRNEWSHAFKLMRMG